MRLCKTAVYNNNFIPDDPGGPAVCGRSLAGVAGLNPDAGMDFVSCECCVLCRYRPLRRADPSYRGVLTNAFVSVQQ